MLLALLVRPLMELLSTRVVFDARTYSIKAHAATHAAIITSQRPWYVSFVRLSLRLDNRTLVYPRAVSAPSIKRSRAATGTSLILFQAINSSLSNAVGPSHHRTGASSSSSTAGHGKKTKKKKKKARIMQPAEDEDEDDEGDFIPGI